MSQTDVPLYDPNMLRPIDFSALAGPEDDGHAPRILLLYGSLRPQSYSRAVAEEGARVLRALGCETNSLIPPACPCPMGRPIAIPRCKNCANWHCGARVWFGPVLSGTGR